MASKKTVSTQGSLWGGGGGGGVHSYGSEAICNLIQWPLEHNTSPQLDTFHSYPLPPE